MLKLLERTISSLENRLLLVAPQGAVPVFFRNISTDGSRHTQLVREVQKLRGGIYFQDGALGREHLTPEGLHETAEDAKSWHLLMVDARERVTSCVWYLQHSSSVHVEDLRVRCCPLARMSEWRDKLWQSVESELARARAERLRYAEVGGWAVSKRSRCTSEGLVLALAGYSLGRIAGGSLGITTATVRHCSSSILRRIGGVPLDASGTPVPPYYDPRYKCEMEILRFDSRWPNAKYADLIERLREKMASVRVIALPPAFPIFESYSSFYRPNAWMERARPQPALGR
jgi:hypothetical protein